MGRVLPGLPRNRPETPPHPPSRYPPSRPAAAVAPHGRHRTPVNRHGRRCPPPPAAVLGAMLPAGAATAAGKRTASAPACPPCGLPGQGWHPTRQSARGESAACRPRPPPAAPATGPSNWTSAAPPPSPPPSWLPAGDPGTGCGPCPRPPGPPLPRPPPSAPSGRQPPDCHDSPAGWRTGSAQWPRAG